MDSEREAKIRESEEQIREIRRETLKHLHEADRIYAEAAEIRREAVGRISAMIGEVLYAKRECVSEPIVARSDDGAIFELILQVGGRLPGADR